MGASMGTCNSSIVLRWEEPDRELIRGFYYIQSIATWYQNRRIKISHIVSKILGDNTDESGAINCIKLNVLFCQADLGALLSWLQKKSLHA
jgi:hypothetical protein